MSNEKDLPDWDESFAKELNLEDDVDFALEIDDEDFDDWEDDDLEELLEDAEDIEWEDDEEQA